TGGFWIGFGGTRFCLGQAGLLCAPRGLGGRVAGGGPSPWCPPESACGGFLLLEFAPKAHHPRRGSASGSCGSAPESGRAAAVRMGTKVALVCGAAPRTIAIAGMRRLAGSGVRSGPPRSKPAQQGDPERFRELCVDAHAEI